MSEAVSEKAKPDPVKAHCPTCDGERTCDVHGNIYVPWHYSDREGNSASGGVDHSLLQCRGCESVFYLKDSWDDQRSDQWYGANGESELEAVHTKVTHPLPENKSRPQWLEMLLQTDRQLHEILTEMYLAYDNKSFILTAVGLRTAFDRAIKVIGIDPAITFQEKLKELKDGGWVGATEHDILDVIVNAGNAAAHDGWSPRRADTEKLITAMEAFLHRAFIVGQDALAIKAKIPAKQKRKKKAK